MNEKPASKNQGQNKIKVFRDGLIFYVQLGDVRAEVVCEKEGDELHVVYSFTPEEFRGRGIASKIMSEVIKYAKRNELKIIPECSFAVNYCNKKEC